MLVHQRVSIFIPSSPRHSKESRRVPQRSDGWKLGWKLCGHRQSLDMSGSGMPAMYSAPKLEYWNEYSMDWIKGTFTGLNPINWMGKSIWFPVNCPLNQSIEILTCGNLSGDLCRCSTIILASMLPCSKRVGLGRGQFPRHEKCCSNTLTWKGMTLSRTLNLNLKYIISMIW